MSSGSGRASSGSSARDRLLAFFLKNVGKVVTKEQLSAVAGISEWARRVRELRDNFGYDIQSDRDCEDLSPGDYRLTSLAPRKAIKRDVSSSQRARILARDGYTCQVCGAGAGEPDPSDTRRRVRLRVDHVVPVSEGGSNEDDNLRALCEACNAGRSNLQVPLSKRSINFMASIRRLPRDVQRQVYEFLKQKFE
ncbi:MAG TPA: HNH endonuclease [Planctomycetes bacterium]|nr:HNH endonuclease [Planctomycetota bacterium]